MNISEYDKFSNLLLVMCCYIFNQELEEYMIPLVVTRYLRGDMEFMRNVMDDNVRMIFTVYIYIYIFYIAH